LQYSTLSLHDALPISADYRELSDSLEALIRRKGGLPGAPVGGPSENYQRLAEKSGSDFDREFVRTVAETSSRAMTLFEQAAMERSEEHTSELQSPDHL